MEGIRFRNPRNVAIVHQRAALGARIAATLIDLSLLFTYITLIYFWQEMRGPFAPFTATHQVLFSLPPLFYHLFCENLFNGKSVGKSAMGIRVIRVDGSPATLSAYLLRWLFRLVDAFFAWSIGILSIILTEKGQRLGDIAAGTTVVREPRPRSIDEIWRLAASDRELRFPQAESLSDRDIRVLQELIERAEHYKVHEPLNRAMTDIKEKLGIESKLPSSALAKTLIADHDQLLHQADRASA